MAQIHGAAFIIIGLIVAAVSFFFVTDLKFFGYIGAAFIVWGALKLLYKKIKSPKENAVKKQQHHRLYHCPYCSKTYQIHDNFCSNCGAFLKNQRSYPNLNNARQHQSQNRDYHQVRRVP